MSPLGLQTASNQKVAQNQKFMLLGHLQVLFYATPLIQNFNLANLDPFWGFWQACRMHDIQKLEINISECFWVTSKFFFIQDPPDFQLLFSKPGNRPLFGLLTSPPDPLGCVKSKSCIKPKFNVWWSPSSLVLYKIPKSQLLFNERGNGPIFMHFLAFDEPVVPQGWVESKSWIKQNVLRIWC